jgi:hypothetical protein
MTLARKTVGKSPYTRLFRTEIVQVVKFQELYDGILEINPFILNIVYTVHDYYHTVAL